MQAIMPKTEIALAEQPREASACATVFHTRCSRLRIGRRSGELGVLAVIYFPIRYMPPTSRSIPAMLIGLIGVPKASRAMIAAKTNVDA